MATTPNQAASATPNGSKKPASASLHGAYSPPASPLGRVPTPPGMPARSGVKLAPRRNRRSGTPWLTFSAFVLTMVWFGIVGFYVIKAGGFTSFLESSGAAAIVAVTGLMLAPAALFWMIFAYIKRASDLESAMEPLLRQLSLVTGQGGVAETRVRRFNDALTEQLSLLKETGATANRTAQKALETLTAERTQLEQSQTGFASQIESLVTTMRQHSGELESIVDSGQDQMNRIAVGAREVSVALAGETHNAETKLSGMLDAITGKFNATFVRLDKEQQDYLQSYAGISHEVSQNLRTDGAEIEGRLTDLLNAVTETLEEIDRVAAERLQSASETSAQISSREQSLRAEAATVSAEIEDSAAAILEATERFRETSTDSRAETERLLTALNSQTDTLGKHAGDARVRLEATRDLITGAVSQLETAATRINAVGDEVGMTIDSRVAALGDAATALDITTGKVTSQLDLQLADYNDTQTEIDAFYATVLERLKTESGALSHAAEKLAAEADNGATRMRASTDELAAAAGRELEGYANTVEQQAAKLNEQAIAAATRVEAAVGELAKTTGQSLDSYAAIAGKADAQATMVAGNFNSAIDRYAGTARQLNVAAAELQQLAARCDETIAEMGSTLAERAENLESVGDRMATTSRGVKEDASVLTVTLQQLTDRLETVRAAATETSDQTVLRMTDIASVAGRNLSGIDQLAGTTLAKLETASSEIARQQSLIGEQAAAIQSSLATVGDDLATRIGGMLGDVERSSQSATALVNGFLDSARGIAPQLQATAASAAESALAATASISVETERFGDRLVSEKTRWQALIDEQGHAFTDTLQELDRQMQSLRAVNADLETGSQRAVERLAVHNNTVTELDTRLLASGRLQGEQLDTVRGEIEKIVDYLQRQALALNAVTQTAIEGVRGATESFGTEARTLGELSRHTEAQIVAAADRMGDARAAATATREDVFALRGEVERTLETFAAQARQLDTTRTATGETAAALSTQASQANQQLAALSNGLNDALERATFARASAFVQLDDVAGRVRGEAETMDATITRLSARATDLMAGIGTAGAAAGRQIESQLDATAGVLRIQLDSIAGEVSSLATSAAETAGMAAVTLRAQVESQLAMVETQAESTLEAIGARADISAAQISSATRILAEAGQLSTEQFERVLGQIGATDATLSQLTEHASGMRRQLVEESEETITALDRITTGLTSQLGLLRSTSETGIASASRETDQLRFLLDQATAQLDAGSRQLQDVSQTAGTYLAGLGQQLETQVTLIRETGSELAALSHDTASGETALTDRLGGLMTQITRARGDLAALDLQLAQQAASLSAQQQETLASLGTTLAGLEQTGSRIIAANSETLGSIRSVETRYQSIADQAHQIASTHSAELEQAVGRTAATMDGLMQSLTAANDEQSRQLATQQDQLAMLYGTVRGEGAASAETLSALADRITAAGLATGGSAQQIIERLGTVAQALIGEFTNVTDAATLATGTLTGETQVLQNAAAQIGLSARTAANDTGEAFAGLRQQGLEVQALMTAQLADTLGTLAAAQENYAALNSQLARQSVDADALLETVGGRFDGILQTAQRTVTQLRQEMEGFTASTTSFLDQAGVDAFGQRLHQLVADLGQGTSQALGDLRTVTAGLESARDRTTQLARETETSLLEATATLETRHQRFADTAEATATRMITASTEVGQTLDAVNEHITQSAQQTLDKVTQALNNALSTDVIDDAEARAEAILAGFDRFKAHLETQVEGLTRQLAASDDAVAGYAERQTSAVAALSGNHTELRREMEQTLLTLTAAARRISETSSDAQNDLSDVAGRLTGLRGVAANAIESEIAELSQLIDGAAGLIGDLGRQLETQVSAVTDAGTALAHVSGSVNDNTAAALSRLQTLNQRLEAAKLSATLATEQAARRVAEILEQVDSDDLDSGIEKAS